MSGLPARLAEAARHLRSIILKSVGQGPLCSSRSVPSDACGSGLGLYLPGIVLPWQILFRSFVLVMLKNWRHQKCFGKHLFRIGFALAFIVLALEAHWVCITDQ